MTLKSITVLPSLPIPKKKCGMKHGIVKKLIKTANTATSAYECLDILSL